ncbi:MAG: glycosyltransferase [Bacteroidales bacterium]|jgi:glycosyltransferase involved in cell wall biosynthesis|nr:glycosyltransferase [Bacteroidales bacterium]
MKIFQIVTLSELGGAQSVVVNLSNALSKEHEVIVIAGEGDGKMFQMLNSGIKYFKLNSLKRKISPVNEIRTICSFYQLYLKYKPDIIHLHSSKAGILGRLVFPKNKVIYTVHGFDSIRLIYKKYLPIERFLQNRCKAIVAVSKYDEKNLKTEHINHNVRCIYNGI